MAYLSRYRDKDAMAYNFNIAFVMLKSVINASCFVYRKVDATV